MNLELDGKVALVTAGSEGLGYACALQLARAGCAVAICARREDVLENAKNKIEAATGSDVLARSADIMKADEIEKFIESTYAKFGKIDILVANSGHIPYGGLFELKDHQWYEAFDLLLMSMVRLSRQIVPIMKKQGKGDIVFISSSAAREPSPHLILSNVLRVGVVSLAKTLATALALNNIRVNTITPGIFDTGRIRRRIDAAVEQEGIDRKTAERKIGGDIPLGRVGSADELAELVTFIASRRAEFLTGAAIQIDGGKAHGLF